MHHPWSFEMKIKGTKVYDKAPLNQIGRYFMDEVQEPGTMWIMVPEGQPSRFGKNTNKTMRKP